ncbi:MAG TPA: nuclear transport factor 2 family protein [Solirubrobacteraceae bacterium]|jgi:hypothetical protein|nr:nuclear transport factor 2 family protein [Solirubrobacteraceae bacterium]
MGEGNTQRELIELERSLWRAETRFDAQFMERTLAADFREFGRSGRVYERADTLAVTGDSIDAHLRDFQLSMLADDVALLTYVSEVQHEALDLANRSSVWVRRDGRWQLRFHQGTPTV